MALLKITRKLTLTGHCTIEVPDGIDHEAIEDALQDEANLFDMLECKGKLSVYDMHPLKSMANEYDIEVTTEKHERNHIELEDAEIAIEEDEIQINH